MIFANERARSSSSVRPVSAASTGVSAPLFTPRTKKFNNPCAVAASSKTSPTRVAWVACATKWRSLAAGSAEELIDGSVARNQLGGVQIPSLVEAVDQRVAHVVEVQPPGTLN